MDGRKFSKWVENTVEKGELLVTSNFSFSHSVFNRLVLQTRKNQGLFGKGLSHKVDLDESIFALYVTEIHKSPSVRALLIPTSFSYFPTAGDMRSLCTQ